MQILLAVLGLVLVLLAPSPGATQPLAHFEDLALRINVGDQIRVADQAGRSATGRFTLLTPDEIVILTGGGQRRFPREVVREVAVRGFALRRGAIVGAAVFAVLGAVATCSNEGGDACAIIGAIRAIPLGAGAGLAIGALVPQSHAVYRGPDVAVAGVPVRRVADVGNSLLGDLGLRVNLGDQLRVADRSGGETVGRLVHLTSDTMTLRTSNGEMHFTRETMREVALRRRPLRLSVLSGAGVGAVAGAVAACTGSSREECVDAPIIAGAVGAGLGLAVGSLIRLAEVVYPAPQTRTRVSPLISRSVIGVQARVEW